MQRPTTPLPFDDEIRSDDSADCCYEVDVGEVASVEDARDVVARTKDRILEGRRLRPSAEHGVIVVTPDGMSASIRAELFPALGEGVDTLTVQGYASWLTEEAALTPEADMAQEERWRRIGAAFEDKTSLTAIVRGAVPDGWHVDVGRPAFLSADQVDLRAVRRPDRLVGMKLEVRVVQYNIRSESLTVSRRTILEERRDRQAVEALAKVHEGAVLRGWVRTLTAYGAFVDLGGIEALLHVSDIPACAARMPAEVLSVGEEVTVTVASYRAATQRIGLIFGGDLPTRPA